MESCAILLYLAEKTGKLGGNSIAEKQSVMQWLFFQAAHVGPMFGQFGHFYKFALGKTKDEYALKRYLLEARRIAGRTGRTSRGLRVHRRRQLHHC